VGLANLGSESETCVGSRVHLVGVFISFEKNLYRLPFTPPSLVRRIGPSLGHLLDDFEDSRRPSSPYPRFRRVPVDGWMWQLAEAETIYRQAPREKGRANRARSGLGRSDQAGRPRPISARFGPGLLPGCFSRDPLFVCTCMWAFDVVSFAV
jgi:hypothetical protein